MPQHAAQQRPLGAAEASPGGPGVRSIRQEAAALRAAQAAGTNVGTAAELSAFFARRQAQRLREAEQRWGLIATEGELVPAPGSDWEWQIDAQANGAHATITRQNAAAAAPTFTGHALERSKVPPPGAPVKRVEKRRGAHPPELKAAQQSCGAQTRARRLLATEDAPSLKAFWPAR